MLDLELGVFIQQLTLKQYFHISQTFDDFDYVELSFKVGFALGPELPQFTLLETGHIRKHHLEIQEYVLFA